MSCKARIGVWAAILLLAGCTSSGDDDGVDNPVLAGTGGAPVMMGPIVGTPMAGIGAAGGSAPVGGGAGSAVGTAGNTATAGAGSGAAGVGGMAGGTAGTEMGGAGGSAGASGMGGAGGMAGGAGTMSMAVGAPCITAGSQVIFIGDSYSNYAIAHASMASMMTTRAIMGGALPMGMRYTDYAVPGTTFGGPFGSIPPQWEDNKSKVPIHLVIMDGGGNDVLIDNPSCLADNSQTVATCKAVVDRSLMTAKTLWASMKAGGVKDVIWFWYPHIPGALSGNGHDINDYTLDLLIKAAAEATTDDFRVYMVDTIPLFAAFMDAEVYFPDGVHANDKGTGLIADAVWKLMKDKCIGQAPASGCCKQ